MDNAFGYIFLGIFVGSSSSPWYNHEETSISRLSSSSGNHFLKVVSLHYITSLWSLFISLGLPNDLGDKGRLPINKTFSSLYSS